MRLLLLLSLLMSLAFPLSGFRAALQHPKVSHFDPPHRAQAVRYAHTRIDRLLSNRGVASRSQISRMIKTRRVTKVDGTVVPSPREKVSSKPSREFKDTKILKFYGENDSDSHEEMICSVRVVPEAIIVALRKSVTSGFHCDTVQGSGDLRRPVANLTLCNILSVWNTLCSTILEGCY